MSGEATTELTSVQGDVDLDAILRGSSTGATEAGADEGSDNQPTNESDQREGAEDERVAQYELRLRNLQATKDREIAAVQRDAEELRKAVEIYEQTMLGLAVEQARAQGGDAAAQQIHTNYQLTRQQQQLQTREQALHQAYLANQAEAAQVFAWKLAADPKYDGVTADELMAWAKYGPEAMVQAAENMALGKRAQNLKTRKSAKADSMGGGAGGATDAASTMQGGDLIEYALKNTQRKSRWD